MRKEYGVPTSSKVSKKLLRSTRLVADERLFSPTRARCTVSQNMLEIAPVRLTFNRDEGLGANIFEVCVQRYNGLALNSSI